MMTGILTYISTHPTIFVLTRDDLQGSSQPHLAAPGFDGLQADRLLALPGAATPSVEFDGSRSTGNGGRTGPVDFFGDVSLMRLMWG